MYLNRCRRPSIWAWTCMNNYRGTSILTWQSRRLTGPEHSLQGTFNHVLRRSRLHVIPLLYAQWWSMPPLLGLHTLCRIAINWNRSGDVLLGLHATDTRKQPAWQQWWTIWSWSHWRPGVTTNGLPCFIVCNITRCFFLLQLITLFRFSGRTTEDQVMSDEMYRVPYARTNVYKYSFFPAMYACGTLYLHLWSILIHFSPSKQPSVFITDTDSRDHRPQCVILGLVRVIALLMRSARTWAGKWHAHFGCDLWPHLADA